MKAGFDSQQQRRIAQQAADWNRRMLEPKSESEVEAFEAWLAADPAHAKAYAESDLLAITGERLPRSMLATAIPGGASPQFRPAFALAGAAILVIAGTLWFAGSGPPSANAALINPGPAARGVTFRDGSAAILDSGAALTRTSDRDVRSVTLHAGRVRFDVPPDGIPLTVTTPQAVIRGSGGIFDVALDGRATMLWVITGDVVVASDNTGTSVQPSTLRSGQMASVRDGRVRAGPSAAAIMRWPAGRIGFTDTALADVVAVANRRGDPPIVLDAEATGALRVTGVLDIRDTRTLARKLAAALDLKVEVRDDEIMLTR